LNIGSIKKKGYKMVTDLSGEERRGEERREERFFYRAPPLPLS
jgi:hypothetical protein